MNLLSICLVRRLHRLPTAPDSQTGVLGRSRIHKEPEHQFPSDSQDWRVCDHGDGSEYRFFFSPECFALVWLLTGSQLKQIGQSMGYMTGEMRREKDGAIISTCEQNKFNLATGMKSKASKL
jgi:hypothetical protein